MFQPPFFGDVQDVQVSPRDREVHKKTKLFVSPVCDEPERKTVPSFF